MNAYEFGKARQTSGKRYNERDEAKKNCASSDSRQKNSSRSFLPFEYIYFVSRKIKFTHDRRGIVWKTRIVLRSIVRRNPQIRGQLKLAGMGRGARIE